MARFGVVPDRRTVAVLLVLFLSGCPNADDPFREGADRTTIVFKHAEVPHPSRPIAQLIARFESLNPDVRVLDEILPANTDQQHQFYVMNLEAASADFDVFALDVIWVPEFATAGWLRDLSAEVSTADRADYLGGALRANTVGEGIYGLPWFVDAGLLYYRKDLLAKHGLQPPETFANLVEAVTTVLAAEKDPQLNGFVWQGRQYEGLVCVALEFILSNGGAVVRDQSAAIEEPPAVEALDFMCSLIDDSISPALVRTADEETTRHLFQAGRALFMRNWPYAWKLLEGEGSGVRGRVGVSPMPRFEGGRRIATLGGWQLGINVHSRHAQAALRFARFMTSAEGQKQVALTVGYAPSRRSVYRDAELRVQEPFLGELLPILELAEPRPVTPYYPMLSQILQTELSAALAGVRTPHDSLRRAAVEMERILGLERPEGK